MEQFIRGAVAMACWVAGLFFLRYFRVSRDRLFLYFAGAFWIFAAHWLVLAVSDPGSESRHYIYALRLVSFGLIVAGIVDKNRRR